MGPSSQLDYAAPERNDADPKLFHYYPRDSRRRVEAPIVVENPALVRVLPPGEEARDMQMEPMSPRGPMAEVEKVWPPTLAGLGELQRAPVQPSADGYFPITNYQ